MADIKISSLPLATSVDGTEITPIVQVSTNKRATLATVKAYVVSDATLLKTNSIGTTVQPYSANTVLDASYVHTDNNYSTAEQTKLAGIADGAEVNVNANWLAVSGDAEILNKPTLAAVATTGAYADLSGKPTLGTAAAAATTDFATAAQGSKADTSLQPAAIGVTVQGYDADLTSWAAIAPSAKQDTLVSGTNIKTINGSSLLGAGDLTISGGGGAGTKTYRTFTPLDNQPTANAFATLDTRNSIALLDFDDATVESAVFVGVIPESANLTNGLKVRINWMATIATSGNVRWRVEFEKMTTDLDADSFDTAAEANGAANTTSGIPTITEITTTTIDSLAAGDFFRLRVSRVGTDGANDTMSNDAELIAVEIQGVA